MPRVQSISHAIQYASSSALRQVGGEVNTDDISTSDVSDILAQRA